MSRRVAWHALADLLDAGCKIMFCDPSMVVLLFPAICDVHCSPQGSKWLSVLVSHEVSKMLSTFGSTL
jgi:hypothetical protein